MFITNNRIALACALGALALTSACSKKDEATNVEPPKTLAAGAKVLRENMAKAQFDFDAAGSAAHARTTDSEWETTGNLYNPFTSDPGLTPVNWFGALVEEGRRPLTGGNTNPYYKNLIGNFLSAIDMTCIVGTLFGGDSLPAAGAYTLAFTAAKVTDINTTCGTTYSSADIGDGMNISVTVTDVTSDNWTKKLVIVSTPGGEERTETVFLKIGGGTINIAQTEKGNDDPSQAIRSVATYNTTEQVTRFEYINRNTDSTPGTQLMRAHITDAGEVRALVHIEGSGTQVVRAAINMSQNATNGSVYMHGTNQAGTQTFTHDVACINTENGNLVTADALCSDRPIAGTANGDLTNVDAIITYLESIALPPATSGAWNFTETMGVPTFSATTIFTDAIASN